MKKILCAILTSFALFSFISCGEGNKIESQKSVEQEQEKITVNENIEKEDKVTQEELNDKLKKDAVKAEFVKLNGNSDANKNLKVFAEGTISNVDYDKVNDIFPSFTLTQEEDGGGYGMYHILNILNVEGLKEGDYVKIYGVVDGENNMGLTKISATIIEKK